MSADSFFGIIFSLLALVVLALTFTPSYIAAYRGTKYQGLIAALTVLSCVLALFPFIGIPLWIGLLVVACAAKNRKQLEKERLLLEKQLMAVAPPTVTMPARDIEEEVRQLARLKTDGLLTAEEFEQKKRSVLGI